MKKIIFGILWFFVMFFVIFSLVIFIGISTKAAIEGWPTNPLEGGNRGAEVGSQLGSRFGGLIFLGSLVVTILLTYFEKLPGTKSKKQLK